MAAPFPFVVAWIPYRAFVGRRQASETTKRRPAWLYPIRASVPTTSRSSGISAAASLSPWPRALAVEEIDALVEGARAREQVPLRVLASEVTQCRELLGGLD
ncbi:MAG: hypothetical protein ABSD78_18735, partial [Acidimicrobiales bacterium]